MAKLNLSRLATLSFLACLAARASAQTLVTDKSDYLPGETVYFAGGDFQPGEDVAISIHVETHTDKVLDYAIGGIDVDAAGEFAATWLVPGEALHSVITATAMGLSSRRVAVTSFTDAILTAISFGLSSSGIAGGPQLVHATVVLQGSLTVDVRLRTLIFDFDTFELVLEASSPVLGVATYELTFPSPCNRTLTLVHVQANTNLGPFFFPAPNPPTVTTASCTPCLVNTPPIISCDPLDLGDLTGCLSEGFSKSVTVSATDFACTPTDPDGDPVTLTFLGPSNLTLVGPGLAEATVTLSATDDPSGRQSASTCPLAPATTTQTVTVRARIVYDFEGPLAPLEPGVATLKKVGSVIPIKFRLRDCAGTAICPSNFPSIGLDANKPRLEAQAVTVLSPIGNVPVEEAGSFDCVPDQLISHEGNCGTGQWSYNLTTKSGAWTAGLTYRANIVLDDGTVHPIFFSLKK